MFVILIEDLFVFLGFGFGVCCGGFCLFGLLLDLVLTCICVVYWFAVCVICLFYFRVGLVLCLMFWVSGYLLFSGGLLVICCVMFVLFVFVVCLLGEFVSGFVWWCVCCCGLVFVP